MEKFINYLVAMSKKKNWTAVPLIINDFHMVTQEKSNNILFYVFFMKVEQFYKETMKQQLKLSSTFNLGSFFIGAGRVLASLTLEGD